MLQEFYVTVTRELSAPVAKHTARSIVETCAAWCTEVGPADIEAAFRIESEATLGFWDASIIACAVRAGARAPLSEDLDAGRRISGIRIVDPFDPV